MASRAPEISSPDPFHKETNMNTRIFSTTALAALVIALAGCAVTRGQETVGAYVDDSVITTGVKARFVDSRDVDAASIKVETLNGTVMLSGFAKNNLERTSAEGIARSVSGVRQVRNEILVRP
jgi:hyperosmotically inducible periplasmic protein